MHKVFAKQSMPERWAPCSFMAPTITLQSILNSELDITEKYWFVCYRAATADEIVELSIWVAEAILPLYVDKYEGFKKHRTALEAVKNFVDKKISSDQLSAYIFSAIDVDGLLDTIGHYIVHSTKNHASWIAYAICTHGCRNLKEDSELKNLMLDLLILFCETCK